MSQESRPLRSTTLPSRPTTSESEVGAAGGRRRWRSPAGHEQHRRSRARTTPCRGRAGPSAIGLRGPLVAPVAVAVDQVVVPAQDRLADQHGGQHQADLAGRAARRARRRRPGRARSAGPAGGGRPQQQARRWPGGTARRAPAAAVACCRRDGGPGRGPVSPRGGRRGRARRLRAPGQPRLGRRPGGVGPASVPAPAEPSRAVSPALRQGHAAQYRPPTLRTGGFPSRGASRGSRRRATTRIHILSSPHCGL